MSRSMSHFQIKDLSEETIRNLHRLLAESIIDAALGKPQQLDPDCVEDMIDQLEGMMKEHS